MCATNNITLHHDNDSDDDHHHPEEDDISNSFISIFYILMSIFTCFGNSATLIAIFRNYKLRTIPNIYIGSLAMADLMVGMMLLVQGIAELDITHDFMEYEEEFCLVRMSMLFVSVAASMLSYLLVTCDRYVYIMHSLKYVNLVTKNKSLLFILVAWILACVYGTVPAYTSNFTHDEGCTPTHVFSVVYMIIVHPIFFLTLSGITFWLYLRIALTALQQQRRIRDQGGNQGGHKKLSQRTWKVVKLLMLVFGFFFICWCPLLVLALLEYTIHVDHLWLSIASLLAVLNSGVNFLVLAAMNTDFRIEFKRILCVCCGDVWCSCAQMKVHPVGISTVASSHWVSSND